MRTLTLLLALSASSAWALGCKATVRARSRATPPAPGAPVVLLSVKPEVKVEGGWFKKLDGFAVPVGGSGSRIYTLTFSCDEKRHWQITVQRTRNGKTESALIHFPKDAAKFTTDVDIDLGEVEQYL